MIVDSNRENDLGLVLGNDILVQALLDFLRCQQGTLCRLFLPGGSFLLPGLGQGIPIMLMPHALGYDGIAGKDAAVADAHTRLADHAVYFILGTAAERTMLDLVV